MVNCSTAGERCTLNAIKKFSRPYYDIDLKTFNPREDVEKVAEWIYKRNFQIVNIAGNGTNSIEEICETFLRCVFRRVKEMETASRR